MLFAGYFKTGAHLSTHNTVTVCTSIELVKRSNFLSNVFLFVFVQIITTKGEKEKTRDR